MSRERESAQSGQRTVADLLAQYGTGQPANGPRRRRRRAEDDSADAPQQIIDRVLSESGRMRAIRDEPAAPAVDTTAPAPHRAPEPAFNDPPFNDPAVNDPAGSNRPAASNEATGYVEQPFSVTPVRPPAPAAEPEPAAPRASAAPEPFAVVPHRADADAPTGYLDRVEAEPPAAVDRPETPGSGYAEQPRGYQEQPTGYVEIPAAPNTARPGRQPEQPGRAATGIGEAVASARDGRAAARASWPVGGLVRPLGAPADEPMTEQLPRVPAAPDTPARPGTNAFDATQFVSPVVPDGLSPLPLDAEETAQWFDYGAEPAEEPEPSAPVAGATSLLQPVAPPQPGRTPARPGGPDSADDGFYDPAAFAAESAARNEPQAGRAAAQASPIAAGPVEDATEDAGSPLRQWLVMSGQLVGGVVAGAALWIGFQFLWMNIPLLALALAAGATVALVFGVRKIRKAEDLQTMLLAVLVGLVVTVTPAAFLLVGK